jgi:hypothetical protein
MGRLFPLVQRWQQRPLLSQIATFDCKSKQVKFATTINEFILRKEVSFKQQQQEKESTTVENFFMMDNLAFMMFS